MLFFTMLLKDNQPKLGRTDEIYIAYVHELQLLLKVWIIFSCLQIK